MAERVLVTGATGFVGGRLVPALVSAGHDVVCASRNPEGARARLGGQWVALDVLDPALVHAALEGIDIAYFLVHAMSGGPGYLERERRAARIFAEAAAEQGVRRIVYLGGVAPSGSPSQHLRSRLETGRILRSGSVRCIELRAGMIVGSGSESWRICRDLAARLPFMVLPVWMRSRSQPVAIDDVIAALVAAGSTDLDGDVYDLPGPETLTAREILFRIARLRGTEPLAVDVPVLTPKLSSHWLRLVTGADFSVARELVEGLAHDLVSTEPPLWPHVPGVEPMGFDRAARLALAEDAPERLRARVLERVSRLVSRSV